MQEQSSVDILCSCGLHSLRKGGEIHMISVWNANMAFAWFLQCPPGSERFGKSGWPCVYLCFHKHIQNVSTQLSTLFFCKDPQLKPSWEILPAYKGNTTPELIGTGSVKTVHCLFQNKESPELYSSAFNAADFSTTDITYCPFLLLLIILCSVRP